MDLSQSQPGIPKGKALQACNTQEKCDYLESLKVYSVYLSDKIAKALRNKGQNTSTLLSDTTTVQGPETRHIAPANEETTSSQETSDTDHFAGFYSGQLISLAPRSPFDSEPYRHLFQQEKSKPAAVPPKRKMKLWTAIGDANSLEVQQKGAKVYVKEKPKEPPTTEENAMCFSSQDKTSSSSGDCLSPDLLAVPSSPPRNLPPKKDPVKEQLRHDAWDILNAAYDKLSYLETLVYHSPDDNYVIEVMETVKEMSQRLTEFVEQGEKWNT